jgi:hypothetical protein
MNKIKATTIYDEISESSLKDMHHCIRRCLEEDDKNESIDKKYGVRTYPDWTAQKNEIELSMTKRGIDFSAIENL